MTITQPLILATMAVLTMIGCHAPIENDPETAARTGFASLIPTTTIEATLANGTTADVYVPTIPSGLQGLFEDTLPVVVLLQGGLVTKDQYSDYADALASYGFVVIVPENLRSFPPVFPEPVPLTEAGVITAALDGLAALDQDPTSPIYRVADTETAALTGHSFGGAISLQAIGDLCLPGRCTPPFELPVSVQAAAIYGANLTTDGITTDIDSSGISVALLQGELDGVAVPEEAEATYAVLEPSRAVISFEGLNHFGITNDNQIPGTNQDPSPQTCDQSQGIRQLALWTALWFNAELRGSVLAEYWLLEFGGSLDGSVTVLSD